MAEFQDSMHFKKINVEKLKKKLQKIETAQRRTAGLTTAEEDLAAVEGENAEEALEKEYDKAYAKWTKELKSLQEDRQTIENWKEGAGSRQTVSSMLIVTR
jgi:transposase